MPANGMFELLLLRRSIKSKFSLAYSYHTWGKQVQSKTQAFIKTLKNSIKATQTLRMPVASNDSRGFRFPPDMSGSDSSLRKRVFINVTCSFTCSYCFCIRPNKKMYNIYKIHVLYIFVENMLGSFFSKSFILKIRLCLHQPFQTLYDLFHLSQSYGQEY